MATPDERAQYARILEDISKRLGNLEHDTLKRLIELLQELRRGIADQLLLIDPDLFDVIHLSRLNDTMRRLVDEFQQVATSMLRDNFTTAWTLGGQSVIDPLVALGLTGIQGVTTANLNVILDFSALLITNIADDMRGSIDRQIRLGVLGQKTPFTIMQDITRILGIKASDGVWGRRTRPEVVKGVAARAEAIARTELTRVFNLGFDGQSRIMADEIPGLKKRWIATGDKRTRDSHLRAHRRYKKEPIPVEQKFEVGGSKLQFPGDPAGPPEETINCRCRTILVVPEVGVIASPLDARIERQLKGRKR